MLCHQYGVVICGLFYLSLGVPGSQLEYVLQLAYLECFWRDALRRLVFRYFSHSLYQRSLCTPDAFSYPLQGEYFVSEGSKMGICYSECFEHSS